MRCQLLKNSAFEGVAAEITQQSNDKQQLVPMLQQVIENVNGKPQVASADTGYWSAANVTAENLQGIDLYVATERQQHGESKNAPVHGLPEGSRSYSRCETS
jgi:hypothetical protein